MSIGAVSGLATLGRIGAALSAERSALDGAVATAGVLDGSLARHAATYDALAVAMVTQDRMLGDLIDAVDRPWLDSRERRAERLRCRAAHEANVVAAFAR